MQSPRLAASFVLAFFMPVRRVERLGRLVVAVLAVAGGILLAGCTAGPPAAAPRRAADAADPGDFEELLLRGGDGTAMRALQRGARVAPLRYRVIVVPGSGCAGMGPVADRYFAGLLHAQVLVLHKPGVAPHARTSPADCSPGFVRHDRLSAWLAHARAALRADALQRQGQPVVPHLLVGISEGAELLPALAAEVPHLAGLVLLSASGLDPQDAGALQARRLGKAADWLHLGRVQAGPLPDGAVLQGRSLGYWRDLWQWPVMQPLIDSPWPVLQVWGGDDALVPAVAYERFAQRMAGRAAGAWCALRIDGADHGLQRHSEAGGDGIQQVWAGLEQWARAPQAGLCGAARWQRP